VSICHHFASVVRLSVNILHADLLENHWTEFNLYLNPMETSYPGERFRLLGGSSLLWYQSTWNWLSPTQCNVLHRWLEFYKSCLQVQFDFLPFCIEKSFFSECAICMDECADTVLYICGHMAFCFSCSQRIQICSIGRTVITDCIKVYKF
jgi:hypothetical protein